MLMKQKLVWVKRDVFRHQNGIGPSKVCKVKDAKLCSLLSKSLRENRDTPIFDETQSYAWPASPAFLEAKVKVLWDAPKGKTRILFG